MPKSYELTILASTDTAEEDLKTLLEGIKNLISQEKGVLEKETNPVKQKLGYAIKEKTEAFLVNLTFTLSPEGLKNLEKELKEKKEILRYIIVIKKPIKEIITKIRRRPEKAVQPVVEEKEESKSEKIELEEIDEKIEEILKE
jgi:small subunit ribosomal protein S6